VSDVSACGTELLSGNFVQRLCETSGFFMISRRSFSGAAKLMVQLDHSARESGNFWHL
jgi:hypothetical protein